MGRSGTGAARPSPSLSMRHVEAASGTKSAGKASSILETLVWCCPGLSALAVLLGRLWGPVSSLALGRSLGVGLHAGLGGRCLELAGEEHRRRRASESLHGGVAFSHRVRGSGEES